MITLILIIIAAFLADKGKRSVVMMTVYIGTMTIFFFIMIVGAANLERMDSVLFYTGAYILELLICLITIYASNRKVEKVTQMKALSPLAANFKLQEERINNKLTTIQVAGIIGINKTMYEKYERGQADIPVSVVIQLAQLYKVSTDYLLGMTIQDVQKTAQGSEQQN